MYVIRDNLVGNDIVFTKRQAEESQRVDSRMINGHNSRQAQNSRQGRNSQLGQSSRVAPPVSLLLYIVLFTCNVPMIILLLVLFTADFVCENIKMFVFDII